MRVGFPSQDSPRGLMLAPPPASVGCSPGPLCVPEDPKITTCAVPLLFVSISLHYSNPSWGVNYKKLSYWGTQESGESRQVAMAMTTGFG